MTWLVIIMLDKVKLFTFFVVITFFNGATSTAHPSHWEATFLRPNGSLILLCASC